MSFQADASTQGRQFVEQCDLLLATNGALLQAVADHPPFVVLTSHLPSSGAGLAMLTTALQLGYFQDVICVYDPRQANRLASL